MSSVTETEDVDVLDLEEGDDRFETVEAVPDRQNNNIHHIRISAKLDDDEITAIAIQPFKDESTPMWNQGAQFVPGQLDEVINGLELIRMNYL